MELKIFFTSKEGLGPIKKGIEENFSLDVQIGGFLSLIEKAYSRERDQYNATILLNHLISQQKELFLWIVNEDLFTGGMNFIFGQAAFGRGAVVSTARLNSTGLRVKEAIHEIGHVLGLEHCKNNCVMQFSNSLARAMEKPSALCDGCNLRLKHFSP